MGHQCMKQHNTSKQNWEVDGNKISSSHTTDPCETRQKAPAMLVGKPQHSHDQIGKHSSEVLMTPVNHDPGDKFFRLSLFGIGPHT